MHQLLELQDERLVRAIDSIEKYGGHDGDPVYQRFQTYRPQICRIAWDAFVATIPTNDHAEICETGVVQRLLDPAIASDFLSILERSPATILRRDDFAMGYMATVDNSPLEILNASNQYREVTDEFTEALRVFLDAHAAEIASICGHPWRVGSIRQFYLKSGVQGGRHTDGWPPGMKKIFILPAGATRELGTTWFRLRNGKELTVNSDKPIWMIFENSGVEHTLVSTTASMRPTIEIDLVTAIETSPAPFYAGINGWYPWFPTESGFLDGTRLALRFAKDHPVPVDLKGHSEKVRSRIWSLPLRFIRKLSRMMR